jgi:hypothetical protein
LDEIKELAREYRDSQLKLKRRLENLTAKKKVDKLRKEAYVMRLLIMSDFLNDIEEFINNAEDIIQQNIAVMKGGYIEGRPDIIPEDMEKIESFISNLEKLEYVYSDQVKNKKMSK